MKKAKEPKLKTFLLHWTAEVRGTQMVRAYDEEDARDQFDSGPSISDDDGASLNASLEEIEEKK